MATNTLAIDTRIKHGKRAELAIVEWLNNRGGFRTPLGTCYQAESASDEDDIYNKIDAWLKSNVVDGPRYSAQIKVRETGGDIGIAVLRPWAGNAVFMDQYEHNNLAWDRDMKTMTDLYIVQIGFNLYICSGQKVKRAAEIMVDMLYQAGGFYNENHGTYTNENCPGATLQLTTDKGAGYSEGQHKVICYLTPQLMKAAGSEVYNTL